MADIDGLYAEASYLQSQHAKVLAAGQHASDSCNTVVAKVTVLHQTSPGSSHVRALGLDVCGGERGTTAAAAAAVHTFNSRMAVRAASTRCMSDRTRSESSRDSIGELSDKRITCSAGGLS